MLPSNPKAFASKPSMASMASMASPLGSLSQTLAVSKSFSGLSSESRSRSLRFAAAAQSSPRRSFVANASELPLVGNTAPDLRRKQYLIRSLSNFRILLGFKPIGNQGVALRGLFIVDKEGVIQHSTINNLAIGRSVDETMRTLQALQYVQDNPDEVCPS